MKTKKQVYFLLLYLIVFSACLVCDHPFLIGDELLSEFADEDESRDPEDDVNYKYVLNPID